MPRIGLTALVVVTAACAAPAPSPPDAGVAPPARWTAAPDAPAGAPDADWIASFADPGLAAAVAEALERNRDLAVAAARVDAAEAEARVAGAALSPAVTAGFAGTRQRQNFIGLPIPGAGGKVPSRTYDRFGVSLDASWELDLWGRLRAGRDAARADWEAAQADLAAARLSLAGQTAKAWFAAAEARRQSALAREAVEVLGAAADIADDRHDRGLRPSADLRAARAALDGARAQLALREEQADRTARQLEILLGRYPAGAVEAAAELRDVPPAVPVGLPAELVGRRPDLAALERRVAAAGSRHAAARANLYPRLALTASGGTSTRELSDLVDGDFRVWSLAANAVQPVFQSGRIAATADLAEAGTRQALAAYAAAALRAYGEVESGLAADRLADRRDADSAAAADESAAILRQAEDRYREGLDELSLVLEARRRSLEAESQRAAARRGRLAARVDLHLALGGGFTVQTGGAGFHPRPDDTVRGVSPRCPVGTKHALEHPTEYVTRAKCGVCYQK